MKKIILLPIIIFTVFFLSAQQKTIDSLHRVLNSAKEDTNKVKILNEITSNYLQLPDYKNALKFGEDSRLLAEKLSFETGAAAAYGNLVIIYGYYGFYEKAFENFLNKQKIAERLKDSTMIISSYKNLWFIYSLEGNYQKALEINLMIEKLEEASGNKDKLAWALWSLAGAYINVCKQMIKQHNSSMANYNYNKAIDCDFKAIRILEENKDSNDLASFLTGIGNIYDKCNLCAESNLLPGTSLIKADYYKQAEKNYFHSLEIYEKLIDKNGICDCYFNLGLFYRNQGNLCSQKHKTVDAKKYYQKSLSYYIKSFKLINELGFNHGIANYSKEVGITYMKLDMISVAKQFLLNAAIRFTKIGYKEGAKESYEKLSDISFKGKDYKNAYRYYKIYTELKDSLINESKEKQQAEMIFKYETEKKEKENINLKLDNQAKENDIKWQRILKFIFLGGMLVLIVIGFLVIKRNQAKSKANNLAQQNKFFQQQEDIKQRISNDLHDEIGSGLTQITMMCNQGESDLKKHMPIESSIFDKITAKSQQLSENLNDLIWATNPQNANLSNLLLKMRAYTYEFINGSAIDLTFKLPDNSLSFPTNPETNKNIFLILKEGLNNIIKHSKAKKIEIDFLVDNDKNFTLEIRDDGNGFDTNIPSARNGRKGLEKRVASIKEGKLALTSIIGLETTLSVTGNLS